MTHAFQWISFSLYCCLSSHRCYGFHVLSNISINANKKLFIMVMAFFETFGHKPAFRSGTSTSPLNIKTCRGQSQSVQPKKQQKKGRISGSNRLTIVICLIGLTVLNALIIKKGRHKSTCPSCEIRAQATNNSYPCSRMAFARESAEQVHCFRVECA